MKNEKGSEDKNYSIKQEIFEILAGLGLTSVFFGTLVEAGLLFTDVDLPLESCIYLFGMTLCLYLAMDSEKLARLIAKDKTEED